MIITRNPKDTFNRIKNRLKKLWWQDLLETMGIFIQLSQPKLQKIDNPEKKVSIFLVILTILQKRK